MVHEVSGTADFQRLVGQKNKLVVVDFTATWCGPCKRVAPEYENLARSNPDVDFLKVVEDQNKDLIHALGIRAFPTFHFYLNGQKVDEVRGANIGAVAAKVQEHKAKVTPAFAGQGNSLGGGGPPASAEDARAARMARFGATVNTGGAGPDPEVARRNAKILAAAARAEGEAPPAKKAAAPANRTVDSALLAQLLDMGFGEARAKKSLIAGENNNLESAINWLTEHQDDEDIDEPLPETPAAAAAAGAAAGAAPPAPPEGAGDGAAAAAAAVDADAKAVQDIAAAAVAELGGTLMSEEEVNQSSLTDEEKAAKVAELKAKLAARRAARQEDEKVDHVQREKARRLTGKEMAKTREELEAQARKREIEKVKREKEAFARERERLRAEIERDKAERKAKGGRLAGKLGVDGYAPAMPQASYGASAAGAAGEAAAAAENGAAAEGGAGAGAAAGAGKQDPATSEERMSKALGLLSRQTVGGEGGTAMKTCLAYIKNAHLKPVEDEKFRSINLDNKAFKSRVANCLGGVALLKAVGFAKDDPGNRLFMSLESRDEALLAKATAQLEAALASYQATNATV